MDSPDGKTPSTCFTGSMTDTETPTLSVAVLGTGIMGAAMARNLARSGHAVRVWNRTRAKAEPLAAENGVAGRVTPRRRRPGRGGRPDHAARRCGRPGTSCARPRPALRPGAAWVQSTTAGIEAIGELGALASQHGLVFFDAPVLGTRQPAEAGQLHRARRRARGPRAAVTPVFDAVGARTVWTGEDGAAGSATRLKLVANSWVLAATGATGEVLALAQALGVDPQGFFDAIAGGPLDMGYLRAKAGLILDDRLTPASFAVSTAAKDARLIVEAGERNGVRLDVAAASAERFRRAAEQGHGDEDMAAAYFASFDEK